MTGHHKTVTVQNVSNTLPRRSVLMAGGAGAGLAALSLTSCGNGDSQEESARSTPADDRPKEAPELTELVESGDLPPLEERLPVEDDRLVVATEEYGVYGGTYRGATTGPGDEVWLDRLVGYEPMLRYDLTMTEDGLPGTLKSVDINDDGTEFTLHLREGMRWSDGEPVTSDDVIFALEEVYFNEELFTTPPGLLAVDGEPCSAEQVDQYTVKLTYPQPKGDFVTQASIQIGMSGNLLYFPQHYFEQFLPHLNDEAEALAEEAGFSDWTSYFEDRHEWWNNTEKPVLTAWMLTAPLNEGNRATLERNPYYWKIDDDGAQLPFIDRMDFEIVQEEEVMLLQALNGELDFHTRHFNSDQNRPVLADGQEDGAYHFITMERTSMNRMIIGLNLNHQDDELREVFQNKDFRIGLSHAIDRQDIIDTVFQRQGEPWQAAPHPDSEYFDEEFAKQFTEYDVELANEHLDAVLPDTDSSGYRLLPGGQRLQFNIDLTLHEPHWATATDMVAQYWEAVGVDARVNTLERTLFYDRKSAAANEHDAAVWGGDGGFRIEMLETRWWFPTNDESIYAPLWANYFSTLGEGDYAEEPPADVLHQMELQWQILTEPDPEAQQELFREIIAIAKDQFYAIGIALPTVGFGIVRNNLRNVADSFADTPQAISPGYINPPTWFFD